MLLTNTVACSVCGRNDECVVLELPFQFGNLETKVTINICSQCIPCHMSELDKTRRELKREAETASVFRTRMIDLLKLVRLSPQSADETIVGIYDSISASVGNVAPKVLDENQRLLKEHLSKIARQIIRATEIPLRRVLTQVLEKLGLKPEDVEKDLDGLPDLNEEGIQEMVERLLGLIGPRVLAQIQVGHCQ